jgi:D-alanyl-D-alanine carboxypeptidase
MQVDRQTLIKLALVSSDNIAAIALGRFGTLLDLPSHTTIIEASGLDNRNKSTARDLAMFVKSLHNSDLANISVQKTATFRSIERRSTNPLIEKRGWNFLLSKTGFTNPAGGCLVVIAEVKQKFLIFVILGASNTKQRWRDLAELRTKIQGDTNFYIPQIVKNVKKQHRKVKRKQR